MKGVEFLVRTLLKYGVEYVFGLPSEATHNFYDTLYDFPEIKHIMLHHENSVPAAALGYAKVGLKPAIIETEKEHATLMCDSIMQAWKLSMPIILFAFDSEEGYRGAYSEQRSVDQKDLFTLITKWSTACSDVTQLPYSIKRAFRFATTGRPGPVYFEIKSDAELGHTDSEISAEEEYSRVPGYRPSPDLKKLKEIAEMLLKAERPTIIAGQGVYLSQASNELIEFAELLGIPVATTVDAIGCMPETHPLSIGAIGHVEYTTKFVQESDLVLLTGHGTGAEATNGWTCPSNAQKIVHIDIEPDKIGRNYPNMVGLVSDAKLALSGLIKVLELKIKKKPLKEMPRVEEIAKNAKEWRTWFDQFGNSVKVPIERMLLLKELKKLFPKNAILVMGGGPGAEAIADISFYPSNTVISAGWPRIELSFLPAIGAKLAAPDRPVIALIGDGSFGYAVGDLETMSRHHIVASIILINNGTWDRNKVRQMVVHKGRYVSTDFKRMNWASVAEQFGFCGIRVERPSEVKDALKVAVKPEKPTLIDVVTADCTKEKLPYWTTLEDL